MSHTARKIITIIGYILNASAILVFFITKAYLFKSLATIIYCVIAYVIGFIILAKSKGREYFFDYLWDPYYKSHKERLAQISREIEYEKSLSPEAREVYNMRKELEDVKREMFWLK